MTRPSPDFPLRGERVLLRPFDASDVAAIHDVYGDPEVMRFVGDGHPATTDRTAAMIAGYRQHQAEHGFAFWAVLDAADGTVIGDAGLEITSHGVELGYTLGRAHWGRGLATEAAGLCVEAAFGPLDLPRLVALVDRRNPASVHVLEKLGFRPDGEVIAFGRPHRRLALGRPVRI